MRKLLSVIRLAASWPAKILLFAVWLAAAAAAQGAYAAELWFAPTDPVWRNIRGWPPNDFMALFRPGAEWPPALRKVRVFEITKRFALESSEADLAAVIETLRKYGVALSVQATPLLWTDHCGVGVEGHGPANDMTETAARIKKLGGELAYATMDEPLWYGHYFDRKLKPGDKPRIAACHLSVDEIAAQAAIKIKALRAIFPKIVIGDDEPLGETLVAPETWAADIGDWLAAYRRAVGEPLGYFHADVVWSRPVWRVVLKKVVPHLAAERVAFGVIYNGDPQAPSDAAWLDTAFQHMEIIEKDMRLHPRHAVFQSWTDRPRDILPEDSPNAFANLILRYEAAQGR
jgi:hypothetical protein